MVVRTLVALVVVSLSMVLYLGDEGVSAISSCATTEVVSVRGSGQIYDLSPELKAVKNLLPSTYKFTELENKIESLVAEPEYAAIAVKGDLQDNAAGLGALLVSRLNIGRYKASVDSGKNLLKKYIEHLQPTDICLALVGYSQGAQVVNETVRDMHEADPNSLKNVIYIGLLGDPLYNPYGFDGDRKPTWVRGSALYPFWGVLFKDVAIPGASKTDYVPRNPSNPLYPFTKIGSWCNYGDVICATNITHYAAMRDGHGSYLEEGIPELVDEIKAAVANPDQNITGAIYPGSVCGAAKQDMVVLLDTSAYMRRDKNLFTKDRNMLDRQLIPGTNQPKFRTFGEQLLDSGCGDKRIAIIGFEGKESPRLLLDFTSRAQDIDSLMESLYTPSDGGAAERPLIREAAILAMQQGWRADASRTLFAITAMAGDGPALKAGRQTWDSPYIMNYHMADSVGQQLIALSRQTRAAIIAAPHLPIDMSGFAVAPGYPGDLNAYPYLQSLARLTGGYNWEKTFIAYPSRHTVKNVNFAAEIQQFETRRDATRVTMKSVRAKVGRPVTLELNDHANLVAGATHRAGHGTAVDWYLDCDSLQIRADYPVVQKTGSMVTFTPTKAGSCTAAARIFTQGSGNGCYWGCPEPFPPYMLKVMPFRLEVLSADYEDKIPGDITAMSKTIYDDRVEFSWIPSTYSGSGSEEPVYLVKDHEGSVLAATISTRAIVTDTEKRDIDILVQAIGADGRSQNFSSSNEAVQTIDIRTTSEVGTLEPPGDDVVPDTKINVGTSTDAQVMSSSTTSSPVVARASTDESQSMTLNPAEGRALGESVVKSVITPAQIGSDLSKTEDASTKWWWGAPLFLLALWGIYRAESAVRRR